MAVAHDLAPCVKARLQIARLSRPGARWRVPARRGAAITRLCARRQRASVHGRHAGVLARGKRRLGWPHAKLAGPRNAADLGLGGGVLLG